MANSAPDFAAELSARRKAARGDIAKVFGLEVDLVWLNERGERLDQKQEAVLDAEPITPREWFAQIVLPLFTQPVFRQRTGKISAVPVLGQSIETMLGIKDRRVESLTQISHSSLHYIFDMTVAGFTAQDVGDILALFKQAEVAFTRKLYGGDATEYYRRVNMGYVPTALARGTDIWVMPFQIVEDRYNRDGKSFVWTPKPGTMSVTLENTKTTVFPRAGGGVWLLEPGGTFAIRAEKMAEYSRAVLRVLNGAPVEAVFFEADPKRTGKLRLKAEYDIYAQKPGLAARAFTVVETPKAHRPLIAEMTAKAKSFQPKPGK
jgi:hypothetical protein